MSCGWGVSHRLREQELQMRKFLTAGLIVLILVGAAIAQTGVLSGSSVKALNASVTRTLAALFADETNAVNYGADPTGAADSTAAINAALAVGKPVKLPAGHYKVTNALAVADNTGLIGAGADATFLEITSAFNSSATGVINLTGRESAGPHRPRPDDRICTDDNSDSARVVCYPGSILHHGVRWDGMQNILRRSMWLPPIGSGLKISVCMARGTGLFLTPPVQPAGFLSIT